METGYIKPLDEQAGRRRMGYAPFRAAADQPHIPRLRLDAQVAGVPAPRDIRAIPMGWVAISCPSHLGSGSARRPVSTDATGDRDRRDARNARYRASSSHARRCAGVAARTASSRASRLPSQVPDRHGSALPRWSFIAMGSSSAWREYAPDGPRRPDPGGGPRHASWQSDRRSTQREPRYRSGR